MQPVKGGRLGFDIARLPRIETQLKSPLGFMQWQLDRPGTLHDGRIVQSRYQNIRLRPMTVDLDSLRTTREYLWSPASPRPMPGAKVSPRTILKPIEMARKNTARELQLELMGDMAGQRRTSTQVSPSLTSQKSIKAARRTVSSFAAAAMEDFEEVDNNQNGLDFEEFKNFFHKRLGPVPAADDFAATPDVEKRDWFQALD
eukprot:5804772-Prymnesium_polylepis.1